MEIRNRMSFAIGMYCALLLRLPGMPASMAFGQQQKLVSCKPAEERTQTEGCWIVANKPLSKLPVEVFWTLDVYPTRESAEKASTINSAVVQALGKYGFSVWEKGLRLHHRVPGSHRSDLCLLGRMRFTPPSTWRVFLSLAQ